jgi:hypothetical protein
MAESDRTEAVVLAELRDVERHLREVPPHHSGGGDDLAARADTLRRELARLRSAGEAEG